MNSTQIAIWKAGVWATIGSTDTISPAWVITAAELLDDSGWSVPTAKLASGVERVYAPVAAGRRVSLRGSVLSDHLPNGNTAAGTLSVWQQNFAALKSGLIAGRTSGNGTVTVTVKVGNTPTTVATLTATVVGVEAVEPGGLAPVESGVIVHLQIAA